MVAVSARDGNKAGSVYEWCRLWGALIPGSFEVFRGVKIQHHTTRSSLSFGVDPAFGEMKRWGVSKGEKQQF
jgi:hypothetical protein